MMVTDEKIDRIFCIDYIDVYAAVYASCRSGPNYFQFPRGLGRFKFLLDTPCPLPLPFALALRPLPTADHLQARHYRDAEN